MNKIKFWLECSRWYALPMSFFSWLIIFSYSYQNNGNALYGFIALIGICFAHLATNLFDDFCDYHFLQKKTDPNNNMVLPNTQRGKCRYLLEKKVKLKDVLKVVGLYCLIALLIGVFFFFAVGSGVKYFILLGAIIVLLYSILSNIRLSELAVGMAFGPLLFGGVYYVMTGKLSPEPFILSIPSMIFTINLLYTDTFMDKDIDKAEGKKTLVNYFSTEDMALKFQRTLITIGYLSVILIPIFDIANWEIFFVFLTIPLAADLMESLKEYSENNKFVPEKKWYHFPFEAWSDIQENRSEIFMFRMYQARNLMIYAAMIISLSLWISY